MIHEEDKLFEPNNDKVLYKVVITVYENCASTQVVSENDNHDDVTYHDLIGVIETQKQHIIWLQREKNMKLHTKKSKAKKVK